MGFNYKSQKASITVFLSLTIVMIMALVLSLIEVVHYTGTYKLTDSVSKIGIESAFADFCRPLLEDFGILGIDAGYCTSQIDIGNMESRMTAYLMDNINPAESESILIGNANFMREDPLAEVLEYGLLSDSKGAPFIKEAAIDVSYGIPDAVINSWKDIANQSGSDMDESTVEELIARSSKDIDELKKEGSGETVDVPEHPLNDAQQSQLAENGSPIASATAWKNKAILSQVIADIGAISNLTASSDRPSTRKTSQWQSSGTLNVSTTERMLFGQYAKQKFSCYRRNKNHGGLDYEWEYLINGKDSDLANLEATVVKLLGLRETQNLASIVADAKKMNEAYCIAVAMCPIPDPVIIEIIKWGIIAAWAYLESVLDVRLLLSGGRVALVKSPAEWTSKILLFPNYIPVSVAAKNCDGGMSYEDYLIVMTMLVGTGNLGMRGLDILEAAIRAKPDYSDVRMENFVYRARVSFTYIVNPIFAALSPFLSGKLNEYEFVRVEELSYL